MLLNHPTLLFYRNTLNHLKALSVSTAITLFTLSPVTQAGPTGGNITGGNGNIHYENLSTTVNQSSQRLAIDWATFNINRDETVNFNQPSRASIALNRINDINPSQIHGQINANGQVILANPNGILFSETSSVNAGGLFAAALNIDSEDFMRGKMDFKALENTSGLIVNQGRLEVIDGGSLALLGQQVKNEGLLVANLGTVALAAGDDISVRFYDNEQLSIQINQNRLADILQLHDPQILNSGLIQAHGGNVVLTANQASAIKTSIVKRDESQVFSFSNGTIVEKDGEIFLAGPGGDISNIGDIDVSEPGHAGRVIFDARNIRHSGNINADSLDNGDGGDIRLQATDTTLLTDNSRVSAQALSRGNGGSIHLLGKHVGLIDNAAVNASGANGGGEVLIGGDTQGSNPDINHAEAVYLGENTSVQANATRDGNGGKLIVWSDKTTRAYGSLGARGRGANGKGGFIETSSHDFVDLQTRVNVSAESGLSGEWLIDPSNLTIGLISNGIQQTGSLFESTTDNSFLRATSLESNLATGANVTVQTKVINSVCSAPGPGCTIDTDGQLEPTGGNITLVSDLDLDNMPGAGSRSLTLRAHHDIIINGDIGELTNNDGDQSLNLSLQADLNNAAGGVVAINGNIDLVDGDLTVLSSSDGFTNNATIAAGALDINANSINSPGALTISGATTLDSNGATILNNLNNNFTGAVTINDGTTVTLHDTNNLQLGNVSNVANLVISADNSISQQATTSINLTGSSSFSTRNGNITLGEANNLGTSINLLTQNTGNATINHTGAVNLTADIAGDLDVSSAGNISDAGNIIVSGASTFRAPVGADIILDSPGNRLNSTVNFLTHSAPGKLNNITLFNNANPGFSLQNGLQIDGNLTLRAQHLTLENFTLGNTATLDLTATAGSITQTAMISHTGDTILSATGNIFDGGIVNNMANVQINAANTATINNGANAISIKGATNTNNLNITATGGITETAAINVSGTTTLDAGNNNISLDTSNHELNRLEITSAGDVRVRDNNALEIAGSMDSLEINAGLAGASNSIRNIADSTLAVNGTSQFTLANGGNIMLDNFSSANSHQLQGAVSIQASAGVLNNVNIISDNIQLSSLSANNANLQSAGSINTTPAATLNISNTTTLQATTLNLQNNNDFNNLVINDSGTVNLHDEIGDIHIIANNNNASNTIDLTTSSNGAITIEGELLNANLSAASVDSTNNLLVENNTLINASTVDLQTNPVNLENLTLNQTANVAITDINNLNLIANNASGPIDITTNGVLQLSGNMTQLTANSSGGIQNGASGLQVSGTTLLDAGNTDIHLNNTANDFNSLQIISAQDASIADANSLVLLDTNVRDLNITTGADLSQLAGSVIQSTRDARLSSNASILLNEANRLSNVTLNANEASLHNEQSLTVNDSSVNTNLTISTGNGGLSIHRLTAANTIQLTAADTLIDANQGAINLNANRAILTAGNGIGKNAAIDTQVLHLEAHNSTSGDIDIKNSGADITLDNITNLATDTGNFNFESTHNVYIDHIALQQNLTEDFFDQGTGTVNMRTAEGSFLGVGNEDINNPDISATNLRLIGVKGTLGTIERPVVLDISGKVELLMRASLNPIYAPPAPAPGDIQDDSIFQFTSGSVLAAVNGVQVTEVETLLDISPAIFTDIRHFVADENPLMLPRDQWFENGYTHDDDDEYFQRIEGKAEQPLIP